MPVGQGGMSKDDERPDRVWRSARAARCRIRPRALAKRTRNEVATPVLTGNSASGGMALGFCIAAMMATLEPPSSTGAIGKSQMLPSLAAPRPRRGPRKSALRRSRPARPWRREVRWEERDDPKMPRSTAAV